MSMIRFDGQVAVVTGAGRGIGRAHARFLASRGAQVVVNDYNTTIDGDPGDSAENPAETVANELRAAGGAAVSNTDSVAVPDGAARIIEQAISTYGRIDILVNNAAVALCDHIHQEPGPLYDRNLDTLLKGPMYMSRAAWPHMQEQNYGRILNTSSASIFGFSWPDGNFMGAYVLAKAAIFSYTRQIGSYGEQFGIKANAILPLGFSRTNADGGKLEGSEQGEFIRKHLPAELVASGAGYLLSTECPVSGECFSAAGGRVARVVFAEPTGFWSAATTPEDIRDHWAEVMGDVSDDDTLNGFHQVTSLDQETKLMARAGIGSNRG